MKKGLFKTTSALMLVLMLLMMTGSISAVVFADSPINISVSVDEDFGDLDIFTMTHASKSADYIFTCIYDRLIELGSDGNFVPSLVTSWQVIPDPNADGYGNPINISDYELVEWSDTITIGGWSAVPEDLTFLSPDEMEFFDGPGTLILELTLRQNVVYYDGTDFNAHKLAEFIDFTQTCSSDTLIYKQWECVTPRIVSDYVLRLYFDFSNVSYGYYDFLYGLTSPIASIADIREEEQVDEDCSMGAYCLRSVGESQYVEINKNDNWWDTRGVYADTLTFYYTNVNASSYRLYDINVMSGSDCYAMDLNSADTVANNPIIIKDCRQDIYSNAILSVISYPGMAAAAAADADIRLVTESPDYWIYYDICAIAPIDMSWVGDVSILCPDSFTCRYVAEAVDTFLRELLNINSSLNIVPTEEFDTEIETGSYDFIIKEVEMEYINSNYLEFYGFTGENNADDIMDLAKKSKTRNTYYNMQLQTQAYMFSERYVGNFGWTTKEIVYGDGVIDGLIVPDCFCPYGNAGRIDFRWVR